MYSLMVLLMFHCSTPIVFLKCSVSFTIRLYDSEVTLIFLLILKQSERVVVNVKKFVSSAWLSSALGYYYVRVYSFA